MPLVAPCVTPQGLLLQGVGAKPTLTERAKGLTATAIDTTTHLLDQAKIHVTGHGAAPAPPPFRRCIAVKALCQLYVYMRT